MSHALCMSMTMFEIPTHTTKWDPAINSEQFWWDSQAYLFTGHY